MQVSLNSLWKLLPINPITTVNNRVVQKLVDSIDKKLETGSETTIDNNELASVIPSDQLYSSEVIPIHYKHESKNEYCGDSEDDENNTNEFNIASDNDNADPNIHYKHKSKNEYCGDTEDDANNTNEFHTASDNENADPKKASDNESDDVFKDNFEDFFRSDVKLNDVESMKQKRMEKINNTRKAKSRATLVKLIDDGLLKDLKIDRETMLNWFDHTPLYTLAVKGILKQKNCRCK